MGSYRGLRFYRNLYRYIPIEFTQHIGNFSTRFYVRTYVSIHEKRFLYGKNNDVYIDAIRIINDIQNVYFGLFSSANKVV